MVFHGLLVVFNSPFINLMKSCKICSFTLLRICIRIKTYQQAAVLIRNIHYMWKLILYFQFTSEFILLLCEPNRCKDLVSILIIRRLCILLLIDFFPPLYANKEHSPVALSLDFWTVLFT